MDHNEHLADLEARVKRLEDRVGTGKEDWRGQTADGQIASPVPTPTSGPSEGAD
jgi:hypothetical protein